MKSRYDTKKVRMLLGDKAIFGVEYYLSKPNFGLIRLWLNGRPIGSFRDKEFYTSIHNQLNSLLYRQLPNLDSIESESIEEIFRTIKKDDSGQFDITILNLGSSFDDFLIRVIKDKRSLIIYWELLDDPFFVYDDNLPKSDIANVNIVTMKSVLDQFNDSIHKSDQT